MTRLRIAPAERPDEAQTLTDPTAIAGRLAAAGIHFAQWSVRDLPSADQDAILAAYHDEIMTLKERGGYATADVVALTPDITGHAELRKKFLFEHTHREDEVRFFVAGSGLFCLHVSDVVYGITAQAGDLIRVPAGTQHWFDMGPEPRFTCIRLFTDPQGWVADATGSDIATRFPEMEPVGG